MTGYKGGADDDGVSVVILLLDECGDEVCLRS